MFGEAKAPVGFRPCWGCLHCERGCRPLGHPGSAFDGMRPDEAARSFHLKAYSDAFLEVGGVQRIPFEALLARIEVSTKAANLDIPIEPLDA